MYDMDDQWPFSSREKLMHSARENNTLTWQIHIHVYPTYRSYRWCAYLEVCWSLNIFWAPKSRSNLINQWYELVGLDLSSQKESSFIMKREKVPRESWNGTKQMTSLVVLIIDFTTCSLEKRLNHSDTNRKTWIRCWALT